LTNKIKFRAWDNDLKIMSKPNDFPISDYIKSHNIGGANPIVLMQFINKIDKYNKDIYHKDLIQITTNHYSYICIVEEDNNNTGYYLKAINYTNFISWKSKQEMEIIGNVFENPELIF
jgi:uncharacterized phage protein (TIGR01671 family)